MTVVGTDGLVEEEHMMVSCRLRWAVHDTSIDFVEVEVPHRDK